MPQKYYLNQMPPQPAKAPEHNPQPQPSTKAATAHEIELSRGGLEPLQKHLGTKPAF